MADDPLGLLSRALDQLGLVIGGIDPGRQAGLPTPCPSWDVGMLVGHVLNGLSKFAVAAAGERPDWAAAPEEVGGDWLAEYRERSAHLLDTWRKADLSGTLTLPGMGEVPAAFPVYQQVAELAVHTWDLATATGQRVDLDAGVAEVALDWARGALRPEFRGEPGSGKAFGPEVEVPAGAPAADRLAGFFGRQP